MQELIGQAAAGASADVFEASEQDFAEKVLEESQNQPVIVDFWAPWCEPCKTLMPALEKAVADTKGAVKLAKVNVDENQMLAQQLRIQSIPAVYAFYQGRPVDGFSGAVPESQLKEFVKRVTGLTGPSQADEMLEAAKEAYNEGNIPMAAQAYSQVMQAEPENVTAAAGLARCLVDAGRLDDAKSLLEQIPDSIKASPEILSVESAIALKEKAASAAGEIDGLRAKVDANADDYQARVDLAAALAAVDEKDEAVDQLIEVIRRDREWEDDLARKELLKLFEAFGPTDPATLKGRRKLSSVLFS